MSTLSTPAYPTPDLTLRKNTSRAELAEPRLSYLPLLGLRAASSPRSVSQSTANPSLGNRDDARISKQVPPKVRREKSVLPSKSDSNERVDTKGRLKEPLGFNLEKGKGLDMALADFGCHLLH